MFDLSEKIALVTGASRGIGKSISMILAQNGAHVICVSRNIDDVQSVANIITDQKFIATAESCDISDSNNVTELVKKIIEKHGRIDILINNAGITRDNLLMRMSDDDWNEVINVNLKAAFTAIKASSRTMIKQRSGRIINISSVVGLIGNAGQANYAASKAGIELTFEIATAIDLAGRDVLSAVQTSVYPKVIDAPVDGKLSAVSKDGIEVRARARVTVRTDIPNLVGGATEDTIIARVGEGIVSAIGSKESYEAVLENPDSISKNVLDKGLNHGTAFEILSIDIADIDVGKNIGAQLQADQAEADLRVAQAKAETRRAMAVALEQEMKAKVVEAESEVPKAMAEAFRAGNLGVLDYYKLDNIASDTSMRQSIAGTGEETKDDSEG